jgi:hypothetical protein
MIDGEALMIQWGLGHDTHGIRGMITRAFQEAVDPAQPAHIRTQGYLHVVEIVSHAVQALGHFGRDFFEDGQTPSHVRRHVLAHVLSLEDLADEAPLRTTREQDFADLFKIHMELHLVAGQAMHTPHLVRGARAEDFTELSDFEARTDWPESLLKQECTELAALCRTRLYKINGPQLVFSR